MADKTIQWLLECDEPWTCYRTRVDLLGQPETDSEVRAARAAMLSHPQVRQFGRGRRVAWATPEAAQRRQPSALQAQHAGRFRRAGARPWNILFRGWNGLYHQNRVGPSISTRRVSDDGQHPRRVWRDERGHVDLDGVRCADVLSRFPFVHADTRFRAMVKAITAQADAQGCYTAGSMYQAWKGWSFADKKQPSPWLTLMALRIAKRAGAAIR